jgi:NTP pyrophosphatase (non-canonical NTP hydrolase)
VIPYLNAYQTLAHKTSRFFDKSQGYDIDKHLSMCTLGIIGELGEMYKVYYHIRGSGEQISLEVYHNALIDECGDVLWYLAEMCTIFHKNFGDQYLTDRYNTPFTYMDIGEFADKVKKYIFHSKEHGKSFLAYMPIMLGVVDRIALGCDKNLKEVLGINIQKLQQRYGEEFSSVKSVQRHTMAGYSVLHKAIL